MKMLILRPFLLSLVVIVQVTATPITFLSANRSVAISGSAGAQGYSDSETSAGFAPFNETLGEMVPGASSLGSQISVLTAEGIQSVTRTSAFANSFAGSASASAQTLLAVTFRVHEPIMFTLAAERSFSGLGVPNPTFQMTDSGGGTVFDWKYQFIGANLTFTEDNFGNSVSAGGLLLPNDYSLLISQSLFFVRPAGHGYDGGTQWLGMDLKVIPVPDTGTAVVMLGATLLGMLAIYERRRRGPARK